MRRRKRLPSYDDDQNLPLDLLVANTHSRKTTAMTTRQFNGLLSILNGLLALFFQDFLCVQCKPFAVMSAKGCAPIKQLVSTK